eukprot:Sdes_comp20340_c0_seq3m14082
MQTILSVDVGTCSVKVALVEKTPDDGFRIMATASSSYEVKIVRSEFIEQDPNNWWNVTTTFSPLLCLIFSFNCITMLHRDFAMPVPNCGLKSQIRRENLA